MARLFIRYDEAGDVPTSTKYVLVRSHVVPGVVYADTGTVYLKRRGELLLHPSFKGYRADSNLQVLVLCLLPPNLMNKPPTRRSL